MKKILIKGSCFIALMSILISPFLYYSNDDDSRFSNKDAITLGLIQGITEFLPISSTGHLILANEALGLNNVEPIYTKTGNLLLNKNNQPYTTEDAMNAYSVIIQGGTILAVFLIYRRRILEIIKGCLGKSSAGLLLFRNLLISFIPAAGLGFLLEDWIDAYLFNPKNVAFALFAGAILLFFTRKASSGSQKKLDIQDLSIKQALFIGILQCFALWPGTSRSMMTLIGGYRVGLKPALAAEYSFLLGLITLSAASGYKLLSQGSYVLQVLELKPLVLGCVVAFVSGALTIKWLIQYISSHSLSIFAWYRILLAGIVLYLIS